MSAWLVDVFNIPEGLARGIQFFVALVFVLILFFVVMFVISRVRNSMNAGAFGRREDARLAVLEQTFVDQRRRLILLRRDDVEHLIMTGGPTDVVVESQIVRRQSVSQQARPVPMQIPVNRRQAQAIAASAAPAVAPKAADAVANPTAQSLTIQAPTTQAPTTTPPEDSMTSGGNPDAKAQPDPLQNLPETDARPDAAQIALSSTDAFERALYMDPPTPALSPVDLDAGPVRDDTLQTRTLPVDPDPAPDQKGRFGGLKFAAAGLVGAAATGLNKARNAAESMAKSVKRDDDTARGPGAIGSEASSPSPTQFPKERPASGPEPLASSEVRPPMGGSAPSPSAISHDDTINTRADTSFDTASNPAGGQATPPVPAVDVAQEQVAYHQRDVPNAPLGPTPPRPMAKISPINPLDALKTEQPAAPNAEGAASEDSSPQAALDPSQYRGDQIEARDAVRETKPASLDGMISTEDPTTEPNDTEPNDIEAQLSSALQLEMSDASDRSGPHIAALERDLQTQRPKNGSQSSEASTPLSPRDVTEDDLGSLLARELSALSDAAREEPLAPTATIEDNWRSAGYQDAVLPQHDEQSPRPPVSGRPDLRLIAGAGSNPPSSDVPQPTSDQTLLADALGAVLSDELSRPDTEEATADPAADHAALHPSQSKLTSTDDQVLTAPEPTPPHLSASDEPPFSLRPAGEEASEGIEDDLHRVSQEMGEETFLPSLRPAENAPDDVSGDISGDISRDISGDVVPLSDGSGDLDRPAGEVSESRQNQNLDVNIPARPDEEAAQARASNDPQTRPASEDDVADDELSRLLKELSSGARG